MVTVCSQSFEARVAFGQGPQTLFLEFASAHDAISFERLFTNKLASEPVSLADCYLEQVLFVDDIPGIGGTYERAQVVGDSGRTLTIQYLRKL
jgi:hypothetical protein